ncbi:MAG TPA: sulfur carrier protein ThiS [Egibacteraceae bacterium]|nr:sulfur carrier protein ThiS [Egibacteraceae bacterium]
MIVVVNGAQREIADDATIADLVADLGRDPRLPGVAVAVHGEIVPRGEWQVTPLDAGQRVEVIGAAQGG